jgi:ribose 5-phosphate isomerase B
MKIAIANDHRGIDLKKRIVAKLTEWGHEVTNWGTDETDSVDYPDFAAKVCQQVSGGDVDRGILVCGSGIGMNIAANKHAGVRSVRAQDEYDAEWSRKHNNANVLSLSADRIGESSVDGLLEVWMKAEFEGGRHGRRVDKLSDIEKRSC